MIEEEDNNNSNKDSSSIISKRLTKEEIDSVMEYFFDKVYYYDINGVQTLFQLSKSQTQKVVRTTEIRHISYMNKILYNKEDVIEISNLFNLRDQIRDRVKYGNTNTNTNTNNDIDIEI